MDLLLAWCQVMGHCWVLELALEAAEMSGLLFWASWEKTRAGGIMYYNDYSNNIIMILK